MKRITFPRLLAALREEGVRFLVVGGWAVVLHGYIRLTHDLDLYLDLRPRNVRKAAAVFERFGYRPTVPVRIEDLGDPRIRREWRMRKRMMVLQVVNLSDLMHPVDLFVHHRIPFAEAWKRRVVVDVGPAQVPLMSIQDLIRLKREANRPQDLLDIAALRELARDRRKV